MPGQSPWSMNIRSCTTTWLTLYRLKQIRKPFNEAGDILMRDLKFFNPTLSNDALQQEATMLADMIDVVFIVGRGAKYEDGSGRKKAMDDMVSILMKENNSIADFAQVNDDNYIFWNEKH